MTRLERWLFPRSQSRNFLTIACLSLAFSFLLIGRQVWQADWGIIDDSEIFRFLGPRLNLAPSELWGSLLTKTEVGTLSGRFRPGYYSFKLIETSLWGANVHLWYLARTIGFAIFLSSIWWFMLRFAGGWLSGVLTAHISLLPMWADVWSRLGPSEIYGATCVGLMVFAAYFVLFSDSRRTRNASAVALALVTIALVGMKETFISLAGGTLAVFALAAIEKKLSRPVAAVLALCLLAALGGIVFVVRGQTLEGGTDFYANPIGPWLMLKYGTKGLFLAILQTWWIFVIPVLFCRALNLIPGKPLGCWIAESRVALCTYGFLVVTYALQCAIYRSDFPLHLRYDFPAMLLVPLTWCILACEASDKMRAFFSERAINYAQLAAAAFLFFCLALVPSFLDRTKPLSVAVRTNIEATNAFYGELKRVRSEAERSPARPIILEAYGPGAAEAVYSLSIYLSTLGTQNRISVRLHRDERPHGKLYDGLQNGLSDLQEAGTSGFTPLRDSLADLANGCISIGINGSPDAGCSGFRVRAP